MHCTKLEWGREALQAFIGSTRGHISFLLSEFNVEEVLPDNERDDRVDEAPQYQAGA